MGSSCAAQSMNYKKRALIIAFALLVFSFSVQAQDSDSSFQIISPATLTLAGANASSAILTSITPIQTVSPVLNIGLTITLGGANTVVSGPILNLYSAASLTLSTSPSWTPISIPETLPTLNLNNYTVDAGAGLTIQQLSEITFNGGSSMILSEGFLYDGQSTTTTITPDVGSPEPSTLAILGLGSAFGFFLHRWRQVSRV
jgi:hypothetical protein